MPLACYTPRMTTLSAGRMPDGRRPTPRPRFTEPRLVRRVDAVAHVWGDDEAGYVTDRVISSTDQLHVLEFELAPGGGFRHSAMNPTIFGADVLYYVLAGTLVLANPETGEVTVTEAGSGRLFHRGTWHNGFSASSVEPETYEDFTAALKAAKDAGEVPIALGTQDGWPASATLLALQASVGDGQAIRDFVFAKGADAAASGLEDAAAVYQEWVDAGYFTPDFAGVPSSDALQDFVEGTGLFTFWYSGFLPFADQAQGDGFGQFILPRQDGGALTAVGSSSQNFSVAANTQEADAAALFLDWMASATAGQAAMDNQIIPMFGSFQPDTDSPMLNDGIESLNAVTAANGYLPYFDWATPTMLDALTVNLQRMFDGQGTPADLVTAAQANDDEFRATK